MAYKAVIFDLDGTLLDTLEDLHASVTAALEANGMPARSVDEVRAALGFGARELIRRCVPAGTPDAEQERAYASFKRHYLANSSAHTRPYPGIPLLVRILSQEGVQRAIVSNKPDAAVQDLAAQYFCGTCFHMHTGTWSVSFPWKAAMTRSLLFISHSPLTILRGASIRCPAQCLFG